MWISDNCCRRRVFIAILVFGQRQFSSQVAVTVVGFDSKLSSRQDSIKFQKKSSSFGTVHKVRTHFEVGVWLDARVRGAYGGRWGVRTPRTYFMDEHVMKIPS